MPERAGYTLTVFAIDVSPSMGDAKEDGENGKKAKLSLVKEYVARKCEPRISSGRKTEAVGILSFGGRTNNQANRAYVATNPEDEEPPYAAVSCDVAIQTAKPKTVEEVLNLEVGQSDGNPVSGLMVALDMIHTHKHTKSWSLEVILITDGESPFSQDEYEDAMARLDDMGVKISLVGIDFQQPDLPVEKTKTRNKRLSEKFWRTFIEQLHDRMSPTTSSEEILPTIGTFDDALFESRQPRPSTVNGTVSGINLHIGSSEIDPSQAIVIPIKYSKATMKARPPSLSKAWKPAMDLQAPPRAGNYSTSLSGPSSQLAASLAQQSQSMENPPATSDLAAMISADVKHHSTYVIKRADGAGAGPSDTQMSSSQVDYGMEGLEETQQGLDTIEEEGQEEAVAKEGIVKAWRFGSTWVPMEADTFEPLGTAKGVEILGFFPRDQVKRHTLMGEVRFIWPDMTSPKAQIQFSSLVEGMLLREMVAVVRWVLKDQAEPVIGLCVPEMDYPGDDKRLDYMFWIKLPFAEDEHNFWFPSLTTYKTSSGKIITEHPLLPTEEQCDLMDKLVQGMDLDEYAKETKREEMRDLGMEEEEIDASVASETWFDAGNSYNPVIHRIKEAIFHTSLTQDLDKHPLGPPHPELTKFFHTPDAIGAAVEGVTAQLKDALDIKKVTPKMRKKAEKEGLRPDEGYIDIDALFGGDDNQAGPSTPLKQNIKSEPASSHKKSAKQTDSDDDDVLPPPPSTKRTPAKPKHGRLISNEQPLEDFKRITSSGDLFKKAIQDMGAVVRENVEGSFSRSAFPLAVECLKAMRETALGYEEAETYNDYIDDLEAYVKAPKFKHKDFWKVLEKEGGGVAKISPEEAEEGLYQDDD